jgi:hypothetical protein
VVRTKVSHGADEVRQPVLDLIGRQLQMDRREFEGFLKGKLAERDYIRILFEKGIVA